MLLGHSPGVCTVVSLAVSCGKVPTASWALRDWEWGRIAHLVLWPTGRACLLGKGRNELD